MKNFMDCIKIGIILVFVGGALHAIDDSVNYHPHKSSLSNKVTVFLSQK